MRHSPTVLEPLRARLGIELEAHPSLRWAYLFGSAARGEPFGDLDIAVMPHADELERLTDTGSLAADLAAATRLRDLTVDVVDLRSLSLAVLAEVLEESEVLLDREPETRRHWEFDIRRLWLDFRIPLQRFRKLRRERILERAAGRARGTSR